MALPSLTVPQLKSQSQQGAKNSLVDASSEPVKTSDGVSEMSARVISLSHNMSTAAGYPLINTGKNYIDLYLYMRTYKSNS